MNGLNVLPTIFELKETAREMRASAKSGGGGALTQAEALEALAHKYGFRNWNVLRAKASENSSLRVEEGSRISGKYLGFPFKATVLAFHEWSEGRYRIKLDFEKPVDVVKFKSFSAFRKRINAEIGTNGQSFSHTSDGIPHLVLSL